MRLEAAPFIFSIYWIQAAAVQEAPMIQVSNGLGISRDVRLRKTGDGAASLPR
jgi:hypothetical protein